jgi:hypothetical protein
MGSTRANSVGEVSMAYRIGMSLVVAAIVVSAVVAEGSDLAPRVSLAGVATIGQVVVSVSGRTKAEQATLRQFVESRLETGGIGVDPSLASRVVASISSERTTSSSGLRHFAYSVRLSFQEPVRSVRLPRTVFLGTTWSDSWRVTRFGADVAAEDLQDALEGRMAHFLAAIDSDTQALGHASGEKP